MSEKPTFIRTNAQGKLDSSGQYLAPLIAPLPPCPPNPEESTDECLCLCCGKPRADVSHHSGEHRVPGFHVFTIPASTDHCDACGALNHVLESCPAIATIEGGRF